MSSSVSLVSSNNVSKVDQVFNKIGRIHVLGMVSGAARTVSFTLKTLADAVHYLAKSTFYGLSLIFADSSTIEGKRMFKADPLLPIKERLIKDIENVALGILEMIPILGATQSKFYSAPEKSTSAPLPTESIYDGL
jgi:hypothetical protein